MGMATKTQVPSPVGIAFLYTKTCFIPTRTEPIFLFDMLVTSLTDNW